MKIPTSVPNYILTTCSISILGILAPLSSAQCGSPKEIAQLTASDGAASDEFGQAIDISGDAIIVGANRHDHPASTDDEGAAYIYRYDGSAWTQEAELGLSGPSSDEYGFGEAVAISGDVAVVGTWPGDDIEGAAFVYRFDGSDWVQKAKLTPTGTVQGFGYSVDIDGDVILVGARRDDTNGTDKGSVYVYRYSGSSWVEEDTWDGQANGDQFGRSVAIHGDTAVVGAPLVDFTTPTISDAGSVYVYEYASSAWTLTDTLTAPDKATDFWFGTSVDISSEIIAVGSPRHDDRDITDNGSAYLYRHSGSSWDHEETLEPTDAYKDANDRFGISVATYGDTPIVGSWYGDQNDSTDNNDNLGSVEVFRYDGTDWPSKTELTPFGSGTTDRFGFAVAVEGKNAVVGAKSHTISSIKTGSSFVYDLNFAVSSCPADFDTDGCLNYFDVSAFLTAYSSSDSLADMNGDGLFNYFDISLFLQLYQLGCE